MHFTHIVGVTTICNYNFYLTHNVPCMLREHRKMPMAWVRKRDIKEKVEGPTRLLDCPLFRYIYIHTNLNVKGTRGRKKRFWEHKINFTAAHIKKPFRRQKKRQHRHIPTISAIIIARVLVLFSLFHSLTSRHMRASNSNCTCRVTNISFSHHFFRHNFSRYFFFD